MIRIDPMFILCCKEMIADGERLVIVAPTPDAIRAYENAFTDEELESIRFVPAAPDAAKEGA